MEENQSQMEAVPTTEQQVEVKPKKFSVTYTEDELRQKIARLQQSEALQLYVRVSEGKVEWEELQALANILNK